MPLTVDTCDTASVSSPPSPDLPPIICLPYAGGSEKSYAPWHPHLGPGQKIIPVALPGRGRRLGQPLARSWPELVQDVVAQLGDHLTRPHILFGHSLGGRLAYELCHHLKSTPHAAQTRAIAVYGCRSPHIPQAHPLVHVLDDDAFVQAVRDMNGAPPEVLDDPLMRRIMMPIVKADMTLAETWAPRYASLLDMPIYAFLGRSDPLKTRADMIGWQSCTTADARLFEIDGDHFSICHDPRPILDALRAQSAHPHPRT